MLYFPSCLQCYFSPFFFFFFFTLCFSLDHFYLWSVQSAFKSKCVSHSVLFSFLWSHGLWPAMLLCLWNSSGKNTGGSCPSLLSDPGIKPGSPAFQADSDLNGKETQHRKATRLRQKFLKIKKSKMERRGMESENMSRNASWWMTHWREMNSTDSHWLLSPSMTLQGLQL